MKILLTALTICSMYPLSGYARTPCAPELAMLKHLQDNFGETVIAEAVDFDADKITITASANGKTWTALVTRAGTGISCIVSAGTDWTTIPNSVKNTI